MYWAEEGIRKNLEVKGRGLETIRPLKSHKSSGLQVTLTAVMPATCPDPGSWATPFDVATHPAADVHHPRSGYVRALKNHYAAHAVPMHFVRTLIMAGILPNLLHKVEVVSIKSSE